MGLCLRSSATNPAPLELDTLIEVYGSELWSEFGLDPWLTVVGFVLIGLGGFLRRQPRGDADAYGVRSSA